MKAKKLFPDLSFKRLARHAVPVDNLESTDVDRPLSANMGREVKELVDENTNNISELDEKIPFKFGIDGDGNYGYYGADDSLIPFKKESIIVGAGRIESPYPKGTIYTFTEDYEEINCIVYAYRTTINDFEGYPDTWFENCDNYEQIGSSGYARHYKLYGIKTGTVINYLGSTDNTYQTFIFFT